MKDDILRQNREGRSSKLLHFKGCEALSMTLERKRMIIMVFRKCWLLVMEVRRKERSTVTPKILVCTTVYKMKVNSRDPKIEREVCERMTNNAFCCGQVELRCVGISSGNVQYTEIQDLEFAKKTRLVM